MATISKLSNPSTAAAVSSSSLKSISSSSLPKSFIGFQTRTGFNSTVASSQLTLRNNRPLRASLVVKCSQSSGNASAAKRTKLHDLYEQEGQSPWYDNLCRPVTGLLPLIASGVRGVTSNPAIFQKAISSSNAYNDQFRCRDDWVANLGLMLNCVTCYRYMVERLQHTEDEADSRFIL